LARKNKEERKENLDKDEERTRSGMKNEWVPALQVVKVDARAAKHDIPFRRIRADYIIPSPDFEDDKDDRRAVGLIQFVNFTNDKYLFYLNELVSTRRDEQDKI